MKLKSNELNSNEEVNFNLELMQITLHDIRYTEGIIGYDENYLDLTQLSSIQLIETQNNININCDNESETEIEVEENPEQLINLYFNDGNSVTIEVDHISLAGLHRALHKAKNQYSSDTTSNYLKSKPLSLDRIGYAREIALSDYTKKIRWKSRYVLWFVVLILAILFPLKILNVIEFDINYLYDLYNVNSVAGNSLILFLSTLPIVYFLFYKTESKTLESDIQEFKAEPRNANSSEKDIFVY